MNENKKDFWGNYEQGVWLIDNKKNGYVLMQDYAEPSTKYGNGEVLSNEKKEFERGELLRKIVSLNNNAIEPVVSYLRAEILLHKDAMEEFTKEYDMPDSVKKLLKNHGIQPNTPNFSEREETMLYYKQDRLEELHYQIYHRLIQNMPFETLETFSQNEVDLISQILLAECSLIYEVKSLQLKNVDLYIPEIFWNDKLRENIKRFLCDPLSCDEDIVNDLMNENIRTQTIVNGKKLEQIVNIRTFSELIALEVQNIMQSPSNFRKCTECIVCGRLFYKKQGKGKDVCEYEVLEGEPCKQVFDDEYEAYRRKIYSKLTSFVLSNAIAEKAIYEDFHKKLIPLMYEYRRREDYHKEEVFKKFKNEVDEIYAELQKKYKKEDLNAYRQEIRSIR